MESLFDIESGMIKEGSNEIGIVMFLRQRKPNPHRQMVEVVGDEVRQVGVLGVIPNLFDRIEFGGVGREKGRFNRLGKSSPQFSRGGFMNTGTIPDHKQVPPQGSTQLGDEVFDCGRVDILGMDAEVNAQATLFGRNGNRRNDGEAVVAVPRIVDRSLSPWRPRPADHRLQHEPALVQKDKGGVIGPRFFLTPAKPLDANGRWLPRLAPALDVRASDNSNPDFSESSKRDPGDSAPQRFFG